VCGDAGARGSERLIDNSVDMPRHLRGGGLRGGGGAAGGGGGAYVTAVPLWMGGVGPGATEWGGGGSGVTN